MLEGALDPGVERVDAVQGQRLGRAETPARRRVGAVVGEDAVGERETPRARPGRTRGRARRASAGRARRGRAGGPRRSARSRAPSVSSRMRPRSWTIAAVTSSSWSRRGCSAHVSSGERGHRDGVLEQPAEVGVVAVARAWPAAQLRAQGVVASDRVAAGRAGPGRGPRRRGARGSRRARRGRGRRRAGRRPDRPRRGRRGRSRAGRPAASRGSARPVRRRGRGRRGRSARRADPRRGRRGRAARRCGRAARPPGTACRTGASRRSLRVQAKTPATSSPSRSVLIAEGVMNP